jgi:hypothetical protein
VRRRDSEETSFGLLAGNGESLSSGVVRNSRKEWPPAGEKGVARDRGPWQSIVCVSWLLCPILSTKRFCGSYQKLSGTTGGPQVRSKTRRLNRHHGVTGRPSTILLKLARSKASKYWADPNSPSVACYGCFWWLARLMPTFIVAKEPLVPESWGWRLFHIWPTSTNTIRDRVCGKTKVSLNGLGVTGE